NGAKTLTIIRSIGAEACDPELSSREPVMNLPTRSAGFTAAALSLTASLVNPGGAKAQSLPQNSLDAPILAAGSAIASGRHTTKEEINATVDILSTPVVFGGVQARDNFYGDRAVSVNQRVSEPVSLSLKSNQTVSTSFMGRPVTTVVPIT